MTRFPDLIRGCDVAERQETMRRYIASDTAERAESIDVESLIRRKREGEVDSRAPSVQLFTQVHATQERSANTLGRYTVRERYLSEYPQDVDDVDTHMCTFTQYNSRGAESCKAIRKTSGTKSPGLTYSYVPRKVVVPECKNTAERLGEEQ